MNSMNSIEIGKSGFFQPEEGHEIARYRRNWCLPWAVCIASSSGCLNCDIETEKRDTKIKSSSLPANEQKGRPFRDYKYAGAFAGNRDDQIMWRLGWMHFRTVPQEILVLRVQPSFFHFFNFNFRNTSTIPSSRRNCTQLQRTLSIFHSTRRHNRYSSLISVTVAQKSIAREIHRIYDLFYTVIHGMQVSSWATGNDPSITCSRLIDSGGFGYVFEVDPRYNEVNWSWKITGRGR